MKRPLLYSPSTIPAEVTVVLAGWLRREFDALYRGVNAQIETLHPVGSVVLTVAPARPGMPGEWTQRGTQALGTITAAVWERTA